MINFTLFKNGNESEKRILERGCPICCTKTSILLTESEINQAREQGSHIWKAVLCGANKHVFTFWIDRTGSIKRRGCWDITKKLPPQDCIRKLQLVEIKKVLSGKELDEVEIRKLIFKGDYDKSLKIIDMVIIESQKLHHPFQEIDAYIAKAKVLYELDKVKDSLQVVTQGEMVLEKVEMGPGIRPRKTELLSWKGFLFQQMGDLDKALDCHIQALTISDKINNIEGIAWSNFYIIMISIERGSIDFASRHVVRLEWFYKRHKTKGIKQLYHLGKALFFKASTRARDRFRAVDILEQILRERSHNNQFFVLTIINLYELLLEEVRVYNDPRVFCEVKTLTTKLQSVVQNLSIGFTIIDTLILQAKLAMVEGDLTTAANILEEAKNLAEEENLELLAIKVFEESQSLKNLSEKWQELIQNNAPFQTRFEQARLEEYVKEAKNIINSKRIIFPVGKYHKWLPFPRFSSLYSHQTKFRVDKHPMKQLLKNVRVDWIQKI